MIKSKVTFGRIHRLLTEHGFVRNVVKDKGVFYENDTGDMIIFRLHRLNEFMDPWYLEMVRMRLDWCGILERDEFDDALEKAAPARSAKTKKT